MTPAINLWIRHVAASSWCSILSADHYSIRTACRGAMNTSDSYELAVHPAIADRCSACVDNSLSVDKGLRELVEQTQPVELVDLQVLDEHGSIPLFAFDMSDLGGEA